MRCALAVAFALLTLSLYAPVRADEAKENKLPEAAQTVLDRATEFELYSLEPNKAAPTAATAPFQGWKVLGKTTVKGEAARTLIGMLKKGIAANKVGARCFIPRHGIRATHEGKTVDLVVCFECSWIYVHVADKDVAHITTADVQPAFDKVLTDAGVPLPKRQ